MALQIKFNLPQDNNIVLPEAYVKVSSISTDGKMVTFKHDIFSCQQSRQENREPLASAEDTITYDLDFEGNIVKFCYGRLMVLYPEGVMV